MQYTKIGTPINRINNSKFKSIKRCSRVGGPVIDELVNSRLLPLQLACEIEERKNSRAGIPTHV